MGGSSPHNLGGSAPTERGEQTGIGATARCPSGSKRGNSWMTHFEAKLSVKYDLTHRRTAKKQGNRQVDGCGKSFHFTELLWDSSCLK